MTVFAGLLLAFCEPTSNWTLFLLGRILQALGTGIVMSLMQAVFAIVGFLLSLFLRNRRSQ
ncbi:hypothetical protein [Lactovum odontotermitis]